MVLAVINQKGGVGKSTTAQQIAAALSFIGKKVLAIDLDAQGNLSYIMGAGAGELNALDVLQEPGSIGEAIRHTQQGDIIASAKGLAIADQLIADTGKEYRLKEALAALPVKYDYIIIDTPPALGVLTINALAACSGAIIPAQADVLSLQGIAQLSETIDRVRKYCNPGLQITGIVLTRYNGRAVISREIAELTAETAAKLHTKVFNTKIRECTAIKEAQAMKQDIFKYAPRSNAAADYRELAEEIIRSVGHGEENI